MLFQRDGGCNWPQLPLFDSNCHFSECIFTMENAGGAEAVLAAPSAGIHAAGDLNGANVLGEAPNGNGQAAVARASAARVVLVVQKDPLRPQLLEGPVAYQHRSR